MAERPSLSYRALDAHVIAGRADQPALRDGETVLTYAELLHESAAIAGALLQLGIAEGDQLVVEVASRREHVVTVLAAIRLGAIPSDEGSARIAGNPPELFLIGADPIPWRVLVQAGRLDPAPARQHDSDAYQAAVLDAHGDVFQTLVSGGTVV